MDSRTCTSCLKVRPLTDFREAKRGLYGRRSKCRECDSIVAARKYDTGEKLQRAAKKLQKIYSETKICRVCNQEKLKAEFYRSKVNVDGFGKICKGCTKEYGKKHYVKNKDRKNVQAREWQKTSPKWRPYRDQYVKEYNLRFPEKRKAQGKLQYQVKKGTIKREPCVICGATPTQGHHPSYDPRHYTWVQWLCLKHHHIANRMPMRIKFLNRKYLTDNGLE
jgi:hypothetical protein